MANQPETRTGITATSRSPMSRAPALAPGDFKVHQHTEVELLVYEHGGVTMFCGGRTVKVPPDRLLMFWGAMPHYAVQGAPNALAHVVRIPMPLVMQWNLPAWLIGQLVDFQVLVDAPARSPCSDVELLKHWVRLMGVGSVEAERIVMLEVEARLRRMAMDHRASSVLAPRAAGAGRLERMVEAIARRCLGRVRIPEITREAGLTRSYAMRLFRKSMGMTMLEYITRQRVSHAQRLLATTDRGVLDVMEACGFSSPTRFYAAFLRFAGSKPGEYRRKFRSVLRN